MKGSLIAILMFAAGIAAAHFHIIPDDITVRAHDLALYTLYALLAFVGFEFGHNNMMGTLRGIDAPLFFLPFFSIAGTLVATVALGMLFGQWSVKDYLAVGSGMGYYSLSSLLILDMRSPELGAGLATQLAMLAFLTNMSRELVALTCAPMFRKYFGRLGPVAAAGVTSVDVTLPVIVKVCGQQTMVVAVVNGIVLELTVPLLVTFFCSL